MREFAGKVAVVTGGASGIGFALAERFAAEQMRVVLADVEAAALLRAAATLRAQGATVLAVQTDVADGASVEALARQSYDAFGAVHILCNNAGVSLGGPLSLAAEADWSWLLGVNLWGVIHGLRAFLPRMLAAGEAGHVVNTSSLSGLIAPPGGGVYAASKFAVVGLTESLAQELAAGGAPIGVSLLCPAGVATAIMDAERNRPAGLRAQAAPALSAAEQQADEAMRRTIATSTPPAEIAAAVLAAIRAEQFYIVPQPEWLPLLQARAEAIQTGGMPRFAPPG
jgi:NAD(P)-dependent dehydrogenase (short-subunit alcohol dehydrogenase family)